MLGNLIVNYGLMKFCIWILVFTVCYQSIYCVKSVQIRSFSWFVFPFIQSEYRKIRTRKNFVFGHFSHSDSFATAVAILPLDHYSESFVFENNWKSRKINLKYVIIIISLCQTFYKLSRQDSCQRYQSGCSDGWSWNLYDFDQKCI